MSVRVMAAVWELDLPQNEKLILLAMADHADDRGVCYPSVGRIAWKSGYSVRRVQVIMAGLRNRHIIAPLGSIVGGRGLSTQYQIRPEKGAKLAPFVTEKGDVGVAKRVSSTTKRVSSATRKGEVAASPESSLTINEPPKESSKAAQATPRPSLLCSASPFSGTHLKVSARQDYHLAEAFPWVERQREYRKIDSWLEANPTRRPKNSGRFLHNWFSQIPAPSNSAKGVSRADERTRSNLIAAGFQVH
jgi:Helix-turn-helix domain